MPTRKSSTGIDVSDEELSGPKVDRRTALKLMQAVGLGGIAGLAGCTSGEQTPQNGDTGGSGDGDDSGSGSTPSEDSRGGRLVAGWNANEINQIDPHFSTLTFSTHLIGNFFSGLLEVKEDFSVQGDLASDWEVQNGGESITFELVENASFHNGNDFTAEDVKYSFNRVVEEETPHANKFASLQPINDGGVVVEDDYTVTLNFQRAFAPILIFLTPDLGNAGAIVSQQAVEEMGKDQFGITPVGTGPFKIVEHSLGSTMKLDAHEGYHKTDDEGTQLPYLDGLDIEPLKEATTRVSAIRTGDVDFLNLAPAAQSDQLASDDSVALESTMGPNFGGLAFNTNVEPFGDRKVRRAVAKALDAERYVEEALLSRGVADNGIYSPAHGWVFREEFGEANDQKPPDQRYNPEEARQLAEEAGIMGLEVDMLVSQPEQRGAQVLRTLLSEELDWTVNINTGDFSTIFERIQNGNFTLIPWGNSVAPDPDVLTYGVFGPIGSTGNYWGYDDEELLELLETQRTQLDTDERKETLWDVEDHIIREAPWVLLEHQEALSARRNNVENYTHFGVIFRFREVWLTE